MLDCIISFSIIAMDSALIRRGCKLAQFHSSIVLNFILMPIIVDLQFIPLVIISMNPSVSDQIDA